MGQWVVTVAGIAILSVLCDVILPDGETRKYVKTVVGIIVTLVMLQPIVNFAAQPTQFSIYSSNKSEAVVQQSYLDMVQDKQNSAQIKIIKDVLTAQDIKITEVYIEQAQKTIHLQIDDYYSSRIQSAINGVVKAYFDNYKISISWKER